MSIGWYSRAMFCVGIACNWRHRHIWITEASFSFFKPLCAFWGLLWSLLELPRTSWTFLKPNQNLLALSARAHLPEDAKIAPLEPRRCAKIAQCFAIICTNTKDVSTKKCLRSLSPECYQSGRNRPKTNYLTIRHIPFKEINCFKKVTTIRAQMVLINSEPCYQSNYHSGKRRVTFAFPTHSDQLL